jgi:hypothetical protein
MLCSVLLKSYNDTINQVELREKDKFVFVVHECSAIQKVKRSINTFTNSDQANAYFRGVIKALI